MHDVATFFKEKATPNRDRSGSVLSAASNVGVGPSRGLRPGTSNSILPLPPAASPEPIHEELVEFDDAGWFSEDVMASIGNEGTSPSGREALTPPQVTPARSGFRSAGPDQSYFNSAGYYPSSGSSSSHLSDIAPNSANSIRSVDTTYTTDSTSGSSFHSNDRTAQPSMASSQVTTTPSRPYPNRSYSKSNFSQSSVIEEEDEEWPSTGPFEVHLSKDGKSVETGTLDGIIRLLVLSSVLSFRDLRQVFWKVYPSFTDDGEVFDSVCEQYRLAGLSDVSGARRAKIRHKVIDFMREWIKAQPSVLSNESVLDRMKSFAMSVTEPETLARSASDLARLLKAPDSPRPQRRQSRSTASTNGDGSEIKWSKLSAAEFAQQLTIIESRLFNQITAVDFLLYVQQANHAPAQGILACRDKNARLSNWIQDIILRCKSVKMRVELFERFTLVAAECRDLGNFSSMCAIVLALVSVAIDRLPETKRGVSKDIRQKLQKCSALLDHNYRAYLKVLESYAGPVIPILDVHLHNIKYNYTSTAAYVRSASGQTLLNLKYYAKVLRRVEDVLRYQDSNFPILENPRYIKAVDDQLNSRSVQPGALFDQRIEDESKAVADREKKEGLLLMPQIRQLRPDYR